VQLLLYNSAHFVVGALLAPCRHLAGTFKQLSGKIKHCLLWLLWQFQALLSLKPPFLAASTLV